MVPYIFGKVDVLIFNPPYVVTESKEVRREYMFLPYSGYFYNFFLVCPIIICSILCFWFVRLAVIALKHLGQEENKEERYRLYKTTVIPHSCF